MRVSTTVAAVAIAIVACGASSSPPSAPVPVEDRLAKNAECERCHASAAVEHRGSLHARAHTDAAFVRAFEREPLPFCTRCHAPEADPDEALGPSTGFEARPALAAGVACVSCHLDGDTTVLAAPRAAGAPAPRAAPHPIRRDPSFATVAACARCHEFDFPDRAEPMQLTVTEHRASAHARTACATCHMPAGERGRRDHRFAASRDPSSVRRAAQIVASRRGALLALEIRPGAIGHAFPTGDLFRRLRIVANALGSDGRVLVTRERILSRKSKLGQDDRPFLDGRAARIELDLMQAAASIRWRVLYERVAHPLSLDEQHGVIEGSIEVASGVLPPD